jgi:peptidylprolyl isomerase
MKHPSQEILALHAGGDLGWIAENQIRPEIKAQVMGLAKNGVSEAIRLDDGWHILKLLDTKAAYTRTLPEVREQLVQQMRSERATAMRRAYLAELLKRIGMPFRTEKVAGGDGKSKSA